jgi:urease accessory protein
MLDAAPRLAGEGVLAVERGAGRSVVTRAAARSPLQLLLPRNHGHAVWAFLASHGGGLVDGDDTSLRVRVGEGATALLATQASTKVYRSPAGCRQRLAAEVGDGGLLVVLPDPVVCFAGARLEQEVSVRLGAGASVIVVDAATCGRVARGERWAFARYRSTLEVRRGDRVLVRDVVELDPAHGALAPRLGRFDALATVIAIGPRAPLVTVSAPRTGRFPPWVEAASPLGEGTLVRAAATSVDELHRGLRALLVEIPALLGDDPFARKW